MNQAGQILRQKREELNISVSTVHLKTHIPVRYINALEADDYSVFLAEVYIVGSMRKYAAFLKLDAEILVEMYRKNKIVIEQKIEVQPADKGLISFKRIFLITFIFLFILVAAFTGMYFYINKAYVKNKNFIIHPNIVKKVKPVSVVEKKRQLELELICIQNSWIKITADDTIIFEGHLLASEQRRWTANTKFDVIIGYSPGVRIKLNGRIIDIMSKSKQDVAELKLTFDDIED